MRIPAFVKSCNSVIQVSLGTRHVLALTSGGKVFQWGVIEAWDPPLNDGKEVGRGRRAFRDVVVFEPAKVDGSTSAGDWYPVLCVQASERTSLVLCGGSVPGEKKDGLAYKGTKPQRAPRGASGSAFEPNDTLGAP